MDIVTETYKLLNTYANSPYREIQGVEVDANTGETIDMSMEISLEEELITLFQTNDIKDFSVEVNEVFNSPGGNIYSISIAFIDENKKLEHITDMIYEL